MSGPAPISHSHPRPPRSPRIDAVGVEERAAALAKRSIKKEAKRAGIRLAISMIDLTTLEGKDSEGKVWQMCQKALHPADLQRRPFRAVAQVQGLSTAQFAALTTAQVAALTTAQVASVATGFPAGLVPLSIKLDETRRAVDAGADEVDMVIDRGAFLSGDFDQVADEIAAVKEACGRAHLKVILETGELLTYDNVRRASDLAIAAGADFIKTSTGKIQPAATPGVVLVMLEAIRDHYLATGRKIGMKPAGGVRTTKQALHLLVLVKETLGDAWLTPNLFRLGASTLTNDLLMQLVKESTGAYQSEDYFSKD